LTPFERNANILLVWDEESVRAFVGSLDAYYEANGRQSVWSRVRKLARSGMLMALIGLAGIELDLLLMDEPTLVKKLQEFHDGKTRPLQLEEAILKVSQAGKSFSPKIHSNYLGSFHLITTSEYPDVWTAMDKKAQLDMLLSGFSIDFRESCKETLASKTHATFWAGLALISIEAAAFTTQIDLEKRKANRESLKKPPSINPKKLPPTDDEDVQRANLLRNGQPNCSNCHADGRPNMGHELRNCKSECAHASCRDAVPHLARTCKEWTPKTPRKANLLVQKPPWIHEDEPDIKVNSVTMSHYNPLGIIDESEMADLDED
jgi:hypothetical protein